MYDKMKNQPRIPAAWRVLALVIAVTWLGGCSSQERHSNPLANLFSKSSQQPVSKKFGRTFSKKRPATEQREGLNTAQRADIQLAMARSMERQKDTTRTMAAYQDVLKLQPNHPVATHRLAVLHDSLGNYKVSGQLFRRALQLSPGNAAIFGDLGYSMYLQDRWGEAEMNLRQAIALNPRDRRTHNNLGLVLAHVGDSNASLGEFRRAGCTATDAHMNLAYVQTLYQNWPQARRNYRLALKADPSSDKAKNRLAKLETLIAKVDPASMPGKTSSRARVVKLPPVGAVRRTSAAETASATGHTKSTGPIAAFVPSPRIARNSAKQPAMKLSLKQPAASVSPGPSSVGVAPPRSTVRVSPPRPVIKPSRPRHTIRISPPQRNVKVSAPQSAAIVSSAVPRKIVRPVRSKARRTWSGANPTASRPQATFDAFRSPTKTLSSLKTARRSPSEPVAKLAPTRPALKIVSSEPDADDSPLGPIAKLAPSMSPQKYHLQPQDADAWSADMAISQENQSARQSRLNDSSLSSRRESEVRFRR